MAPSLFLRPRILLSKFPAVHFFVCSIFWCRGVALWLLAMLIAPLLPSISVVICTYSFPAEGVLYGLLGHSFSTTGIMIMPALFYY